MDMASLEQAILDRIDPQTAAVVRLKVVEMVDSTNERLRIAVAEGVAEPGQVLIAGQQTAGRGRLGRRWLSPPGANLYLSLCWRIDGEPAILEGLSLAVGCAVAECLASDLGVSIQLKWPNDLYLGNAKCGGVLIELATDPAGDWWVVIGLGLNVAMPAENAAGIVTPWTDLASHASTPPEHTQVAGLVITALAHLLLEWPNRGFAAWQDRWMARDLLHGERIRIQQATQSLHGRAAGIDAHGALCLETDEGTLKVQAGDATIIRGSVA